uniref:(California timema) hypothetical protein n=1 Tax=Timema californicum TaxID=61474 RepID=A0A7R9JDT5_TIMCA|nr:unnamed protein product [Timema californicum]
MPSTTTGVPPTALLKRSWEHWTEYAFKSTSEPVAFRRPRPMRQVAYKGRGIAHLNRRPSEGNNRCTKLPWGFMTLQQGRCHPLSNDNVVVECVCAGPATLTLPPGASLYRAFPRVPPTPRRAAASTVEPRPINNHEQYNSRISEHIDCPEEKGNNTKNTIFQEMQTKLSNLLIIIVIFKLKL